MKRLKEEILEEMEYRILSEKYTSGERLPSERELASEFSVSRPVIHEALLILESKGLVKMRPRHGVLVCDVRESGTIDLLSTLMTHSAEEKRNDKILESLYRVRALMESDAALLACKHGTKENLEELEGLINRDIDPKDFKKMAFRDFEFHHLVARMSGNIVYPLIINSMKSVYLLFLEFYYSNSPSIGEIQNLQRQLLQSLQKKDQMQTAEIMKKLSSYTVE